MAWHENILCLLIFCGLSLTHDEERISRTNESAIRKYIDFASGHGISSAIDGSTKDVSQDGHLSFRHAYESSFLSDIAEITCQHYQKKCPHYCINEFHPEVNLPEGRIEWHWNYPSQCPVEIASECNQLGELNLTGSGDNSYCFKRYHEVSRFSLFYQSYSGKLYAIFYHGSGKKEVPARRKCGNERDCFFGYCLKRKGGNTACGQREKPFQPGDPHPDCLLKTMDNSSLRISEDEWCCRNPDGCGTPVGKCSQSKDCYANYCIGVPGAYQSETRCPEGKNETEWEECENLKYRQTKWIPGRNAWCCIPEKNNGCDYKVRSCGSNLSCRSKYCIREKDGESFRTICPENPADRRCAFLQEGQELIISPELVCCRRKECFANGTICGDSTICEKDYCVAWKSNESSELTTSCPTYEEDRLLKRKCSMISTGSNIMVKNDTVWCCKRRHCSIEDTDESTSTTSTSTTSSPAANRPDRNSLLKVVLAILIIANVVTCGSCCVGVVCCRLVMFERKRARNLRQMQMRARSLKGSSFENTVDVLLEKILYGKDDSSFDQTDASTNVTEETRPGEETEVGSSKEQMKSEESWRGSIRGVLIFLDTENPEEAGEGSNKHTGELVAMQQSEANDVTKTIVFENESENIMKQE